ncbi:MAG: thioredoxin family protein [bacterium]|jgi:thioredoxin 1
MANNGDQKNEGEACGCGVGSCCSGLGKWIWIILALAVAGVLVVKNVGKKESAPPPVANLSPVGVEATSLNAGTQEKALPHLVDLGAGKCIPCKMMAPILEDLKKTLVGKLEVQFIDVWENPDAGKKYGINVIPTQIFYDAQGKELFRHEGFFGKDDILAKWKEFGVDLK